MPQHLFFLLLILLSSYFFFLLTSGQLRRRSGGHQESPPFAALGDHYQPQTRPRVDRRSTGGRVRRQDCGGARGDEARVRDLP